MDTKCEKGSKCTFGGYCKSKTQTIFCNEQIQEESSEGKHLALCIGKL